MVLLYRCFSDTVCNLKLHNIGFEDFFLLMFHHWMIRSMQWAAALFYVGEKPCFNLFDVYKMRTFLACLLSSAF